MPKRIDKLTKAQEVRMPEWADKWIEIGLRTGEADWGRFEAAARECYRFAGIPWPGVVVRVPSPLVGAFAAPVANHVLQSGAVGAMDRAVAAVVRDAVDNVVGDVVRDVVGGAVDNVVHVVGGVVDGVVRDAVDNVVGLVVGGAVGGAVGGVVDNVVHVVGGAVGGAVDGAVGGVGAVDGVVRDAVRGGWANLLGGQFWAGGWYWGGAYTSFFREVCGLELPGDLWDRARAYEATIESACWWWPNRQFVMVCDRPKAIHLEQIGPRGRNSHRLHCTTGPAVAWDGWGVYAIHGVRVPAKVVEQPEALTREEILGETNAEVRRVMIERLGPDRFTRISGAKEIASDERGKLWRINLPDDEPFVAVEVVNSTPEPDGSFHNYILRVPPGMRTPSQAVAWTFGLEGREYAPAVES